MAEVGKVLLVAYCLLALGYFGTQVVFAQLHRRRTTYPRHGTGTDGQELTVSVVVPVYNEDPEIVRQCLTALCEQDYPDLEIFVVDDGSAFQQRLADEAYDRFTDDRVKVILLEENQGKRDAHKVAFDLAGGDVIVTIDSDTVMASPRSIRQIVSGFRRADVGAVTGDTRVLNTRTNFLTRLIGYRYWVSFHQERAAQSYFDTLLCCSGPFSAYRRSIVDKVKEQYVAQSFFGIRCTFGDDRYLTYLVLQAGYRAVFDRSAVALTYVPDTVAGYLSQQIRWNKSLFRDAIWTFRSARDQSRYLLYDLGMQILLPAILLATLLTTLVAGLTGDPGAVLVCGLALTAVALIPSLHGAIRNRDPSFVLFLCYAFLYVLLLLPARVVAILRWTKPAWGTR